LCESTNIHSIAYDQDAHVLQVHFHLKKKKGVFDESEPRRIYEYMDFPEAKFLEFLGAVSKGAWFQTSVKGRYVTRRIQ
jgi:hypothetical protein